MKEQAFNNVTMEQLNNVSRLTTRPFPSTLGREGEIFMAEPGNGEILGKPDSRPQKPESVKLQESAIFPELSTVQLLQETGVDAIKNPVQLIAFVSKFRKESEQALSKNPFEDWSIDRLKKQYLAWHVNTSRIESQQKTFGEQEAIGGYAHPYSAALVEELERRQVDIRELFLEATKRAAESEVPTRSIGAATRNLTDYNDPFLQNIVRENNVEVARVGEGNPLDPEFIRTQRRRVGDLLDQGRVDANEGNRLLGDLNSWWAEVVGAERRYGSFYGERRLNREEIEVIRTGRLRVRDPATGEVRDVTPEEAQNEVDRIFNRMFDRVDVSPKVQFGAAFGQAGQIEFEEFRRTLNEAAADEERTLTPDQRDRAERLVRRYAEEFELREIAHNANYALAVNTGTEELANFVQRFSDSMGDLAFRKEGVVEAFHFHEQALLKIREENGGYLPPYEATGEQGRQLKGRLEELVNKYMDTRFPDMPKWKKDRAISLARGMGVISGRTIEIAASSRLPEERGDTPGPRFASMYAQKILQEIAPFRHLIYKYDMRDFRDRIFAYLLDRDRSKPWSKEELGDFDAAQRVDIINGLVEDEEERFLSVLNPWRIGGVLSRTTWRIGRDPSVGALGDFAPAGSEHENWVGTGVQIELLRGSLLSPERRRQLEEKVRNNKGLARERAVKDLNDVINGDPQAEQDIRSVLGKVAQIQPLKLFFNLKGSAEKPGLQERVLENLGKTEIDQELQDDLDVLVVLQEKAVHDALYDEENNLRETNIQEVPLNFDDATIVGDPERAERLRRFVEAVQFEFTQPQVSLYGRSRLDRFVDDLRNKEWRMPFNFGTDDAPLNEYRFSKAGGNAFARRWNDMVEAGKATAATIGLMDGLSSFKTQEPVVAAIKQIYNPLANIDESLAKDRSMAIAEGVMKFYKKDWYARLPAGIGTLFNITGRHSFAELAYGKGQMSWDEVDLNGFTRLVRDQATLTLEQQHELQGKAGGTRMQTVEGYVRLLTPIIILALIYYVAKEATEATTKGR